MAGRAGLSQDTISLVERGRIDGLSLRRLRAIAAALDAELVVTIRWRAGDLDRLLDEGHAALVGRVAAWLEKLAWDVRPDVTFSIFGERGSIDLLGWHSAERTLIVVEVKTELTSIEETLRRHDAKLRLAGRIGVDRFGWQPRRVARLLVLPNTATARRRVRRHEAILGRAYPLRSTELRRWLRAPGGHRMTGVAFRGGGRVAGGAPVSGPPVSGATVAGARLSRAPVSGATVSGGAESGLVFVSFTHGERGSHRSMARRRVRVSRSSVDAAGSAGAFG